MPHLHQHISMLLPPISIFVGVIDTLALLNLLVAVIVIGREELFDPLDLVLLYVLGQGDRVGHLEFTQSIPELSRKIIFING